MKTNSNKGRSQKTGTARQRTGLGMEVPLITVLSACVMAPGQVPAATFGDDVAFLKKHGEVVVLSDKEGRAQVALVPGMQGRVMTSTAGGAAGASFGWINRDLIASGKLQPHINVFGGEDRFWLGPEGGQYSIFFANGAKFDLEHWFTPAAIDTVAYPLVKQSRGSARFEHAFAVTNYSGFDFNVAVRREVELLSPRSALNRLGVKADKEVAVVAFETVNRITNTGKKPWVKETGLLSVWILGMFNPSPSTTVVVPIKPGPESKLGKPVNADYFGAVPPDRLVVKDKVLYFSADGQYRSKIGLSPRRCLGVLGSYDAAGKVLTLVQFSMPKGRTDYVNSMWELQKEPYAGDAANSYNDGPPSPGAKPLGPFYELESSSPAAALAPGKSLEHVHRTLHLQGTEASLDPIARATLGVGIEEIKKGLGRKP